MIKHCIRIPIITAFILFLCSVGVFSASFGYEFSGNQVKIKNSSVAESNEYVTFEVTPQDETCSFYYVDQFSSGTAGWWSKTFDMSNAPEGVYNLTVGGTAYNSASNLEFYYAPDNSETKKIISGPVDLSEKDKYIVYGSDGVITAEFLNSQSSGTVLASFDVTLDGDLSSLNLWISNKNGTNPWTATANTKFAILNFSKDKIFGMYSERNDYTIASGSVTYEKGIKYHIDLWFDMDSGKVMCYLDNAFFKTLKLNENLGKICNIFFHCSSADSKTVIENFNVKTVKYNDNDLPTGAPSYVMSSVNTFITTNSAGNIFYDKNANFDLHIVNRTEAEKSCVAEINIKDSETDETVYTDTLNIDFSGLEHKIVPLNVDMGSASRQFGLFNINVSINEDNKSIGANQLEFSVINTPYEQNAKSGVSGLFVHGYYDPDILTSIMANGGFGVIRDTINYNRWLDNGKNLSAEYNRWKDYADSEGFSQVIMLDGIIGTQYSSGVPYTDADREKFAEFAESVAQDLSGRVECFELYNELNWSLRGDPNTYAKLIICAKEALQKGNPNAKLCAFASARIGLTERMWIEEVLKILQTLAFENGKQVKDYIDVVSVHPYKIANRMAENNGADTVSDSISDTVDTNGTLTYQAQQLRKLLDKYGLEEVPLIATELGWSSTLTRLNGHNGNADPVSPRQQAEYSVRAAMLLQEEFDLICWFTTNDNLNQSNELEKNFGLLSDWRGIENTYCSKPIYAALANYNAVVGSSKRVSDYEQMYTDYETDGVMCAEFENGITSVWTTVGTGEYVYNTDAENVKVYDIYGNESVYKAKDGAVNLTVSTSPIYVKNMNPSLDISFEINQTGVRAKLSSTDNVNEALLLVIASYNDEKLSEVNIKNIGRGFSGLEYTDYISNTGYVKAFLWSEETLTPFIECIELTQ